MTFRVTMRNEVQSVRCPVPGCDYANPSGIQMTKHYQRVHVSRNEPGSSKTFPSSWVPGGMPITDVGGVRERLEGQRKAYEVGVRAQRTGKTWGRRVA